MLRSGEKHTASNGGTPPLEGFGLIHVININWGCCRAEFLFFCRLVHTISAIPAALE